MNYFRAMTKQVLFILLIFISFISEAKSKKTNTQHGLFIYWGWNWENYTKSNLHLKGTNYDFTLQKIAAKDRQSPFGYNPYFKINTITIPQYNFRVGYIFKKKYSISFAFDHMKYVMQNNQVVKINGTISNTNTTYDGTYNNADIVLKNNFLTFEHTDGLNYLNIELRKQQKITSLSKIKLPHVTFNGFAGAGVGILFPRTNTKLLNYNRYDEFHVAGFGTAIVGGFNLTFWNTFFIQTEAKLGFIDMPDIRTTEFKTDKGKQNFGFFQRNIVLGLQHCF